MKKERAIYKCRRCGKEFEIDALLGNYMHIDGKEIPIGPLVEAHKCEDGKNGFGDIIGSYIKEGE